MFCLQTHAIIRASLLAMLTLVAIGGNALKADESAVLIGRGEWRPGDVYAPVNAQAGINNGGDEAGPPPAHPLPPPQRPAPPPHGGYGEPGTTQTGGGKPDPLTPRSHVFDPGDTNIFLGNDPQLAVGERFVIGIEAHHIAFFDKKTGKPLDPNSPNLGAGSFFALFLSPTVNGKFNPNDVNRHIANRNVSGELHCDPDNPTSMGCVTEAYDTRVLYDRERQRFWILSGLRNEVQVGCDQAKTHTVICVPEDTPLRQRFVAVAVSRTGDPRDGFCEFLTVRRRPGDWPLFAVHGPFLVIGSNGSTDVTLLDAGKLAMLDTNSECGKGDDDVGLGTYTGSDFGNPDNTYPVVQHDKRDETDANAKPSIPVWHGHGKTSSDVPTFLIAASGSHLTVFAFEPSHIDKSQTRSIAGPPLNSASIDLDTNMPFVPSDPVYRNGRVYIAGNECPEGTGGNGCIHRVRVIVVPVFRNEAPGGSTIVASNNPSLGFEDFTIGGRPPREFRDKMAGESFEIPAIDVNKDGDFAVVYDRAVPGANPPGVPSPFQPGVTYSVFYRAEHQRRDGVLQAGICNSHPPSCPSIASPVRAGLDLGGIAVDPSDDSTVWMSHGFEDGHIGQYRMVIGNVQLRGKYTPAKPHQAP